MQQISRDGRVATMFAAAVFVSACLLFQVQPLVAKAMLPRFGGTPSVWTTCLLFFQAVLFAGYLYAHLLSSWCPPRAQAVAHLLLLAGALLTLRVLPSGIGQEANARPPAMRVLELLALSVGFPYFSLSTTGPLLQRWFSLTLPGRSPYRLYALSNAGSLLALLSYPFVFEPLLTMTEQARWWTAVFGVFAGLTAACAVTVMRLPGVGFTPLVTADREAVDRGKPGRGLFALWFGLSLVGSVMLLALTNQVSQDVAAVPFLWVAPLSLYLLSFILCFESDRWYWRRMFAVATTVAVLVSCWLMVKGGRSSIVLQAAGYFAMLFCACMLCHGELARRRPAPAHLTAFYLTIAAGGAAGGLLGGLVAPLIFPAYWELHLGLLACLVIALGVFADDFGWIGLGRRLPLLYVACAILLLAVVGTVLTDAVTDYAYAIAMKRNFYGVLQVEVDEFDDALQLRHGRTLHGLQLRDPEQRGTPTAYYGLRSGVGRVLQALQQREQRIRVGVVGMGVGTLAAYGRKGDTFRFYEINKDVERLARSQFTFLSDTPANVETVLGDARLSLETESSQQFDLLVLDAFSSDAIPMHLLTQEAMKIYLRHVLPDGLIALHLSSLHFDLRPVADALAAAHGLHCIAINDPGTETTGCRSNTWAVCARNPDMLNVAQLREAAMEPQPRRVLWTDDYSNLLGVLEWWE